MRHIVRAFLMLFLLSGSLVGYAQTPEATPAPIGSVVPLPSTPQTQQTPDNSTPAPTPATPTPAKATKPKRHHISGVQIGILVGTGMLVFILLKA
jgi:hypothetical protein